MSFFESQGHQLYFEEHGGGEALVFLHEFGGDIRSWHQQIAFFSAHYRCIALSCRGYPPSDVPRDQTDYGWQKTLGDVVALLDHLGIEKAHFVGLSMGAFTGLMICLRHPDRVRSLVAASGGVGRVSGWARSIYRKMYDAC